MEEKIAGSRCRKLQKDLVGHNTAISYLRHLRRNARNPAQRLQHEFEMFTLLRARNAVARDISAIETKNRATKNPLVAYGKVIDASRHFEKRRRR
jgi:hypothetical protein